MGDCKHAVSPFSSGVYLRDEWVNPKACPYCRVAELEKENKEANQCVCDLEEEIDELEKIRDAAVCLKDNALGPTDDGMLYTVQSDFFNALAKALEGNTNEKM